MRAPPPERRQSRHVTGPESSRPSRAPATDSYVGERVSGAVVVVLILASTAISLYDLRLILVFLIH